MENKYSELIAWLKNFPDATKITKEAYNEGVNIFATLNSNRSLLRFFQCRLIVDRHKNMLHSQLTQILKSHINVINVVEEKKAIIIEQQKKEKLKTPRPPKESKIPKETKEKKKDPQKKPTETKSSKKKQKPTN